MLISLCLKSELIVIDSNFILVMAEQAQTKIQEAMTTLVDDLDKTFLRNMQRTMHLCAASCCEKKEMSVDQVHSCIEQCSTPLTQAQSFIQKELSEFQERLQRCVMVCQDKIRDKVTANTKESQVAAYKAEFESCALLCVDDHIKLIPSTKKRIADVLGSKS